MLLKRFVLLVKNDTESNYSLKFKVMKNRHLHLKSEIKKRLFYGVHLSIWAQLDLTQLISPPCKPIFVIRLPFRVLTFCRMWALCLEKQPSPGRSPQSRARVVLNRLCSILNGPKVSVDILGQGRHNSVSYSGHFFLQMRKERSDPVKPVLLATAEGERLNSYGSERADCCWV